MTRTFPGRDRWVANSARNLRGGPLVRPDVELPETIHELAEYENACAYATGYAAAIADIAQRHAELDAAWRPVGRVLYDQRVADRIAQMQAKAITQWPGLEHGGRLPSADWSTGGNA